MAEMKKKVKEAGVEEFLSRVEDEQKRKDCFEIVKIMQQVTKKKPKMWGPAIIGFGSYHYKYESGRAGDMPQIAFSPANRTSRSILGWATTLTIHCSRNLVNIQPQGLLVL